MAYNYVIKQGSTQIKTGTTTTDEFSYEFPKNTGTTDIVYTIDVDDDNGCSESTSVTVPTGSTCQPQEEICIYIGIEIEGDDDYPEIDGFKLKFEFADSENTFKTYDLDRFDFFNRTQKLVAPAGCSFGDYYNIWVEDWGDINSCGYEVVYDPLQDFEEDINDGGTYIFKLKKAKAKLECELDITLQREFSQTQINTIDCFALTKVTFKCPYMCAGFTDQILNGSDDYLKCVADISIIGTYIDRQEDNPALSQKFTFNDVEFIYTVPRGNVNTTIGTNSSVEFYQRLTPNLPRTYSSGKMYEYYELDSITPQYNIKSIEGKGQRITFEG